MHKIVLSVQDETYNKIATNAKLERRAISIYTGLIIDNLFKDIEFIKSDTTFNKLIK
jgi:hypothetical protein